MTHIFLARPTESFTEAPTLLPTCSCGWTGHEIDLISSFATHIAQAKQQHEDHEIAVSNADTVAG